MLGLEDGLVLLQQAWDTFWQVDPGGLASYPLLPPVSVPIQLGMMPTAAPLVGAAILVGGSGGEGVDASDFFGEGPRRTSSSSDSDGTPVNIATKAGGVEPMDEDEHPHHTSRGSKLNSGRPRKFLEWLPSIMACMSMFDASLLVAVIRGFGIPCDVPLLAWAIVGLLLGWPATFLVYSYGREESFKGGFVLELLLLAVSFCWLCAGMVWVNSSVTCIDTSPLLWWTVFVNSITSLSITSTIMFCMVVTTVRRTTVPDPLITGSPQYQLGQLSVLAVVAVVAEGSDRPD
ncbi:hypothetical protein FOZ62_027138 [Perkinsus olseni]|uniref:Transmembrane protein n=2 Tax=Perkinsus olseni TaxID=32597 RepID=A0A7J6SE56_PEROL|nr:hypothetical protein FOZ62_027138 [Perkinsus olseni]